MHVLVTGGAGFIGSHVVEALLAADHDVRILDALLPTAHPGGRAPDDLDPRAEFVRGDVREPADVRAALAGIDAVSHQAAMVGLGVDLSDLPLYAGCNDLGTAVLLAGMADAGVSRLVLASSMVVYGEGRCRCPEHGLVRPRPRERADLAAGRFEPRCPACAAALEPATVPEDAPLDPRNGYAATKVAQEHLAATWSAAAPGRCVTLRYHNVYGPRMPAGTPYAGVASVFRSELAAGRAPQVYEDGAQRRDFVHVRDVARANVLALAAVGGPSTAAGPRAVNIASGRPRTVLDMAVALAAALDGPPPVVTGEFRVGDVRHIVAEPARAAAELGFRAEVTFEDGMREFAASPEGARPRRA